MNNYLIDVIKLEQKDERNETQGEKEMKEEIEDKVFQENEITNSFHDITYFKNTKNFPVEYELNTHYLIASVEQPPELAV